MRASFIVLACLASPLFSMGLGSANAPNYPVDFSITTVSPALDSNAPLKKIVNTMLTLRIKALSRQTAGGERFKKTLSLKEFSARMPEHNHGMMVLPKISQIQEGEWLIEGVKFHMEGRWNLVLTFADETRTHTAALDIFL